MDFHFGAWHGHIYPFGVVTLALPFVVLGVIAALVVKKRAAKLLSSHLRESA